MGTSINNVPRFLAIFDLPTYLALLYKVPFWGLSWTPLPTLIADVINGRSLSPKFCRVDPPILLFSSKITFAKKKIIKTNMRNLKCISGMAEGPKIWEGGGGE